MKPLRLPTPWLTSLSLLLYSPIQGSLCKCHVSATLPFTPTQGLSTPLDSLTHSGVGALPFFFPSLTPKQ